MTLHQQRVQGAYGVSLIPLPVLANKYARTPSPADQLQLFFKKATGWNDPFSSKGDIEMIRFQ